MSKTREELGNNDPYVKPAIQNGLKTLLGESLVLYTYSTFRGKRYQPFYGIGIVYRVVKGDKQDLLYIRFGAFPFVKTRLVVVFSNHARRQLLTLKRGQPCQVYGICRQFSTEIILHGKKTRGIKMGLYAIAVNGWYVPTSLDIKKMPKNEDVVEPTDKEKNLLEDFDKLLDEFYNGDIEDEEN